MQTAWDRRYGELGKSLRASMCKALPELLNGYVHRWQVEELEKLVPEGMGARLLDAGCGHGRLAHSIVAGRPGAMVFGLDGSGTSIQLYNENMGGKGAGCAGDVLNLPFADHSFDLVFLVTVLMYLEKPAEQEAAVRELMRVTRQGGKLMIVENNRFGRWPLALGSAMARQLHRHSSAETTIPGVIFSAGQIPALVERANAKIVRRTGIPIFTNTLPFLFMLALVNESLCAAALGVCRAADTWLAGLSGLSLYVSYEIASND